MTTTPSTWTQLDWTSAHELREHSHLLTQAQREQIKRIDCKIQLQPHRFGREGQLYRENAYLLLMADRPRHHRFIGTFLECGERSYGKRRTQCRRWLLCPWCAHILKRWPLLATFGLRFEASQWWHLTLSYEETLDICDDNDNFVGPEYWTETKWVLRQMTKNKVAEGAVYRTETNVRSVYPTSRVILHTHAVLAGDLSQVSADQVKELILLQRQKSKSDLSLEPNIHLNLIDSPAYLRRTLAYSMKALNLAEVYREDLRLLGDDRVQWARLNLQFGAFLMEIFDLTAGLCASGRLGTMHSNSKNFCGLRPDEQELRKSELLEVLRDPDLYADLE